MFAVTQLPGKKENQIKDWHSLHQASRRKRLTRVTILMYYQAAFKEKLKIEGRWPYQINETDDQKNRSFISKIIVIIYY